jgi:hypothetical protein
MTTSGQQWRRALLASFEAYGGDLLPLQNGKRGPVAQVHSARSPASCPHEHFLIPLPEHPLQLPAMRRGHDPVGMAAGRRGISGLPVSSLPLGYL